jgi:hypothetical protein
MELDDHGGKGMESLAGMTRTDTVGASGAPAIACRIRRACRHRGEPCGEPRIRSGCNNRSRFLERRHATDVLPLNMRRIAA